MSIESRAVVLAAGQGTRMNSEKPKVCHRCFGEPMLTHVQRSLVRSNCEATTVVVGVGREKVQELLPGSTESVVQDEQLGTGHALQTVLSKSEIADETTILVTCGDIPGVQPETYDRILTEYNQSEAALALLTVHKDDPTGYGRVIQKEKRVRRIVEEKDATVEEKEISLVNTGIMCGSAGLFRQWLPEVSADNQADEYYLTEVIELLNGAGETVRAVEVDSEWQVRGINTRRQLVDFERTGYRRIANEFLDRGVTIHNPDRVKIGPWVELEKDVEIDGPVTLWGETTVKQGTRFVGPTNVFNAQFGKQNFVRRSHITEAKFGNGVQIGPFCHVRPGTRVEDEVRLGNFVEAKQSQIKSNTNVSHLSYIGDTELGREANIGAGTITCNYDGYQKHKTVIGDEVFVGSNCELVAPVEIESGAMIGAGSTVTEDVPADSLAVSRAPQETKNNWVKEEWKPRKEQENDDS